jgi:hypothetical protein
VNHVVSSPRNRKGRAESVNTATECGDASACLKLRIPLIRTQPADLDIKGRALPRPSKTCEKRADADGGVLHGGRG